MRKSIKERFMNKVEFDPNSGCWLWTGSLNRNGGYGEFWLDGKKRTATHIALELFKETTKPDGMVVCHSCNTPSCINPSHLSYDTQANNMKYMVESNRQNRGIEQHSAKLNEDKVREIRLKIAAGNSLRKISKEYNVDNTSILNIKKGKTWKHVS